MKAPLLILLLAGSLAGAAEAGPLQLKAAVHVHSTFSTGDKSLEELAQEARRKGIDALILTDNLLLRFEYGLFPLRGLVRKVVEKPSVLQAGLEAYLGAVDAVQARFPDVVLVPGVEVVPYYYWTGSLFTHDLTMWGAQRNLLVVGLPRVEDYRRIPAIGNGRRAIGGAGAFLRLGLAVTAMAGGFVLLTKQRIRTIRLTYVRLTVQKRYRLPGWTSMGVGVLLLGDALMSPEASRLNPYEGDLGIRPYQDVIDAAEARGGMTFWSLTEARDFNEIAVGPLGTVTVRTEPHPEVLLESGGYTGFGAMYPDTVTVTEPGQQWDRLLGDYAEGRRARPAWGIGEVAYHGSPKPLDEVVTMVWARERSRQAILAALRAGQVYPLTPRPDYHLRLDEFSISQEGMRTWVPMGAELRATGPRPLLVSLRLSATDGRAVPVAVRLIRTGRVASELQMTTPVDTVLTLEPPAAGAREFVRIEVTKPHPLLSNPIFVRRPE
ncbi:MAG: hypothetical protein HY002_01145 [Candidatus Rokubacteria bacterium]|nr:hypothetical protein [Candidatus Rokubacteria bacterium]